MEKTQKLQNQLRWVVRIIALIVFLTFTLAIIFYPEQYLWFEEFLSNLGRSLSRSGLDNGISKTIFIIGFLISSGLSFLLGCLYLLLSNHKAQNILKGIIGIFMGVGALGTGIPPDKVNSSAIHIWGTGLFIFSFIIFNLICQYFKMERVKLNTNREKIDEIIDKIWVILTLLAALSFLLAFIFWWEQYIAILQKILVLMIFIAVIFLDQNDL